MVKRALAVVTTLLLAASLTACGNNSDSEASLVVYSGRSQEFIEPFFERFSEESGIKIEVRYGDSAALAAQILEEGSNTPADLFLSQDAGALGAVSAARLFTQLPENLLNQVAQKYKSTDSDWIALTGRARVFAYAPDRVKVLPKTVVSLTDPTWKGRIGIAPTNSSFQAFVTAMIQEQGELATEAWLRGIMKNSVKFYEKNSLIVQAIDSGEIDAGLTNHYYKWEVSEELGRPINVEISFFGQGDIGNLVNVSGAGIMATSKNQDKSIQLIAYLLSKNEQARFVTETHEYSIVDPSLRPEGLPSLNEIKAPNVDLASLGDLEITQRLLVKVGML